MQEGSQSNATSRLGPDGSLAAPAGNSLLEAAILQARRSVCLREPLSSSVVPIAEFGIGIDAGEMISGATNRAVDLLAVAVLLSAVQPEAIAVAEAARRLDEIVCPKAADDLCKRE